MDRKIGIFCSVMLCLFTITTTVAAQTMSAQPQDSQAGHDDMPKMDMAHEHPKTLIAAILHHGSSGTSVEPPSTPHPEWMIRRAGWTFMFHGNLFINELQQSGLRGTDKFFSTNWFMPMAQRELGPGTLTVRTMLSLEPATISDRRFPALFQLGEKAFGKPIVDGQHPHDFFMELAALYDVRVGEHSLVSFYAAPVGDPALGPPAYAHRSSSSENPMPVLGHHLQDSTHIVDEVVTAGYTYRIVRVEFSGFHGREPDESRWNIDAGGIDSWAARLTVNPLPNWSGQFSIGTLKSPEELSPREDLRRTTASISYNRPLHEGNWASTAVWGRNRSLASGEVLSSYLLESTLHFYSRHAVWGRIENVDRTNLLLIGENPLPTGFEEHFLARVQSYTAGYDREFPVLPHFSTALGGEVAFYGKPSSLDSIYGKHPAGAVIFVRIRPKGAAH